MILSIDDIRFLNLSLRGYVVPEAISLFCRKKTQHLVLNRDCFVAPIGAPRNDRG